MGDLPQIPSHDVGLGLASAVLLFLATYLLARTRTEGGTASQSRQPDDRPGVPFLGPITLAPSPRGLSFVASLFAHLVVVAAVPSLQIVSHEIPPVVVPRYDIIVLDYKMPLPPVVALAELDPALEFTAPREPALEAEQSAESEQRAALGTREGGLAAPPRSASTVQSSRSGAAAARSRREPLEVAGELPTFQVLLPDRPRADPALRDIVLQPDFTIDLPADYSFNLPPVMLWAQSPVKLETGAILEPVMREDVTGAALPDLEAQVLPPNNEPALADLQMPRAPVLVPDPQLALPPADVVPLAGRNPLADLAPPSSVGEAGRNSLIALTQQPDLQSSRFDLQPGLRLGSIDSAKPSGTIGPLGLSDPPEGDQEPAPIAGEGEGTGSGDATDGDGSVESGSNGDSVGDSLSGLIASVSISGDSGVKIIELRGAGEGSEASDGAGGSGRGENGGGLGAGGAPDGEPDADGHLRPLPRSQYGIILISNTRSELSEAKGVLTGTPVYTVYIDVPEAPRKWVLQYCVPRSTRRTEIVNGVIRVRTVERVDPPHALKMEPLRLEVPDGHRLPRRIVVYAVVTEEGSIEDFRVIRGADPETDKMVLANLQSWDFHPAFQRGEPVSVEALFGIPLQ